MSALKEKILEKMKEHTLASFATVTEDGKPWTRYVVVKADEELNIWFVTFLNSRKTLQIAKNPEVHLALGVNDPQTAVSWLQVQGRAELLEDAETKNGAWHDTDSNRSYRFMQQFGQGGIIGEAVSSPKQPRLLPLIVSEVPDLVSNLKGVVEQTAG